MQRIEVNLATGEKTVIDLTPEEIADAEARRTEVDAQPKEKSFEERLAALEAAVFKA